MSKIDELRAILKRLRAPDGCPWDRVQTLQTLKPCLQEECYELLAAIDENDAAHHREELGDVLLQVVFQCAIREEEGAFTLDDVIADLNAKLIRRHPHVFGEVEAKTVDRVLQNWERIKQTERKKPKSSALDGVPDALPALLKAQRTQAKASRVGFDWKDSSGAIEKVREEFEEFVDAAQNGTLEERADEFGDILFALVNVARFLEIDAEGALRGATAKFSKRFKSVEQRLKERGREMKECTLAELDAIWEEVKKEQREQV
ncbi:MAG: nucleoside triphosphate pyrophosphohydrolase [Kiritimatiellia bacterium]|nr:nucleoside triphosphate pyrophosphohydrolase [Kiritimatiellia bacterium]